MVVEDSVKLNVKINGKSTVVSKFAHTLRRDLYKEHLNISDEYAEDPLNDELINQMSTNAAV